MTLYVGTDIGGTFTDLVGFDANSGSLVFGKSLTNYADLVEGVANSMAQVDIDPAAINVLKHGTTYVINTLIERKGARTALLTTRGFADILEIGRAGRPLPFDLDYARQPPLVPRHLRFEIGERIDGQGTVIEALDLGELDGLIEKFEAAGIDAVAICLLNAYRNPEHELALAADLRAKLPDLYVTASTELSREWFEYERMSTAVANAYVGPRTVDYVERFDRRMTEGGFAGRFFLMGSNGGIMSADKASEEPIALVESGPIGGCIGAAAYAERLGFERMIAFDMGGTTAKCALVEHGRFEIRGNYHIGSYEYGFPIQTAVLDIVEVGTGGGSIARVDAQRRLHVGPQSAGSDPGPICFQRGGTEPTVTDANAVLGRIGSGAFVGGALRLDPESAAASISDKIGRPMGYAGDADVDIQSSGIIALANVQMASAIKEITIERGKDAAAFALFVFGGGGPLHGVSLARELHIGTVIVPPEPGNFSALGMLLADARIDETATFLADLAEDTTGRLAEALDILHRRVAEKLGRDFPNREVVYAAQADMRYKGQRHAIRLSLPTEQAIDDIRQRFTDAYRHRYGRADGSAAIEFIGLRVIGTVATERPDLEWLHRAPPDGEAEPAGYRQVYFGECNGRLRTPIYSRERLPIGTVVQGPAVIEEFGATTLIGPDDSVTVGVFGELRITVHVARPARSFALAEARSNK